MEYFFQADILLFAFAILAFLLVYSLFNAPQKSPSKKIFITILITLMINCALAAIASFPQGNTEPWAVSMNMWVRSLLLTTSFLPAAAWVAYIDFHIFNNFEATIKHLFFYLIPLYIGIILIVINFFTGFMFTIENGIYTTHYGIYIFVAPIYIELFLLLYISRVIKKRIKTRIINIALLFMLFPIGANIISMVYPQLDLVWPAFSFSTFIVFVLLEKDAMLKDSLTKLNTRVSLESRVKHKLRRKEPFSLIMIDLDGFKQINDTYGHKVGDDALMVVASILEDSVKRTDMVCRYGGDEFLILVESPRANAARYIRDRIKSKVSAFNKKNVKPYVIAMSFGLKFYNKSNMHLRQLMNEVDRLMYTDKQRNRRLLQAEKIRPPD